MSPKKGEIRTAAVTASADKHKIWLIGGIAIVVVLVLLGVFLSPAKEALFGKVVYTLTPTAAISPSSLCIDLGEVNGVNIEWPESWVEGRFCTDIGCSVNSQGLCLGTRTRCPDVTQLTGYGNIGGSTYEQIRQRLCSSAGCQFRSGTNFPTTEQGDICVLPERTIIRRENSKLGCTNNLDDDGDRYVDGRDSDCRNVRCATNKVWIWSYPSPLRAGYDDASVRPPPDMISCCRQDQCIKPGHPGDDCVNIDVVSGNPITIDGTSYICGSNNNWDLCSESGNKNWGDVSDSGKLSDSGNLVCQQREHLGIGQWVAPGTTPECADGTDNDNDGTRDCADRECGDDPYCLVTEICDAAGDEDHDGFANCADSDCVGNTACPTCTENWQCGEFACTTYTVRGARGYYQQRTCTDSNNCETTIDRPYLIRAGSGSYSTLAECQANLPTTT